MGRNRDKSPINVLPLDLAPEDISFANIVRVKRERRGILGEGAMKKIPEGDDVTMVTAYQETTMLRSEKLLHEAAKMNKVDATVKILARGINVNCANNLDRTAIQWAASYGAKDVIKVLLQCDANLESEDKYGMRASLWAAWFGHVETLKFLMACGAKPDVTNRQGMNILHCAANQNRVEVIDFIINFLENFDLDTTDRQERTALHIAAKEGHSHALEKLISVMKPENLSYKDKSGQTPFLSACQSGDLASVEALLDKGCDINEKDASGKTALHLAAENGHSEVCEVILKFPEPIQTLKDDDKGSRTSKDEKESRNSKDGKGSRNSKDETKSKNSKDEKGSPSPEPFKYHDDPFDSEHESSALHLCVHSGHSATVRILASNGCNVNKQNKQGDTPLHLAAMLGTKDAIVELIRNGAFLDQANYRLQTPLHVAVEKGNSESVNELLRLGANARAQEKSGRTPLYMATRGSFTDIVDLIIRAELKNQASENNNPNNHVTKQNGDALNHIVDEVISNPELTSLPDQPQDLDIIDAEPEEAKPKSSSDFTHPHAELIQPILHRLAHKQLSEKEWKKLARIFKFSPEHIKALEHHYEGKHGYRNQGYRMLLIWLHGHEASSNPTVELSQALLTMGKNTLAEEVRTNIMQACGEETVRKKRCVVS